MATQPKAVPAGKDPIHADSAHYKVEVENEKVRVVRARYGAHEKSKMHAHPRLILVALTDAHCRFTYPDGRTEEIQLKTGQVMDTPAVEHLPENLTDRPMEVVLIELK